MIRQIVPPRFAENVVFLSQWLRGPRSMGAILPSSSHIGNLMGSFLIRNLTPHEINPHKKGEPSFCDAGYVLEIGAGTGAITRRLLEAGVPEHRLILVEVNPDLATILRRQFPKAVVVAEDAQNLERILSRLDCSIAAAVSGLPFLSLPKEVSAQILESLARLLPAGGCLLQFSYKLWGKPFDGGSYGFTVTKVGTAFWNVPPAIVWSYAKDSLPLSCPKKNAA